MMPEWQLKIVQRYREAPGATVQEHASALGVSPEWLAAIVKSDAFRAVLAREGLADEARAPSIDLRDVGHLFTPANLPDNLAPPAPETLGGPELDRSAFGVAEKKELFNGQKRLHYSHEAMIDAIIENPGITKVELARMFGYTPVWVTKIFASKAFQDAYEKRRKEIIDPALIQSVEETFGGLIAAAADVVHQRIAAGDSKAALRTLDIASKMLSAGMRQTPVAINNYVAVVPPKLQSAEEWSRQYQQPIEVKR